MIEKLKKVTFQCTSDNYSNQFSEIRLHKKIKIRVTLAVWDCGSSSRGISNSILLIWATSCMHWILLAIEREFIWILECFEIYKLLVSGEVLHKPHWRHHPKLENEHSKQSCWVELEAASRSGNWAFQAELLGEYLQLCLSGPGQISDKKQRKSFAGVSPKFNTAGLQNNNIIDKAYLWHFSEPTQTILHEKQTNAFFPKNLGWFVTNQCFLSKKSGWVEFIGL